jgi:hypothetical protein
LDTTLKPAWGSLSDAAAQQAWAQGSEMSLEQAIQYSMEEV